MNALVIPEDPRKDKYLLKPIIKAMLAEVGKPRMTVRVCEAPVLGGTGQALRSERIQEIIEKYPQTDLFLLCVDRDGQEGRRQQLDTLEEQSRSALKDSQTLFAENAWQEVEVWVLAGHDLPKEWTWKDIRAEANSKDVYFEPFAEQQGASEGLGDGRKRLAEEAARHYKRIRTRCPEDVAALEDRVRCWVSPP